MNTEVDARVDRSVSSERLSPPRLYHVVIYSSWPSMAADDDDDIQLVPLFPGDPKESMHSCRMTRARREPDLNAFQRFGSQ